MCQSPPPERLGISSSCTWVEGKFQTALAPEQQAVVVLHSDAHSTTLQGPAVAIMWCTVTPET